MFGSIFHALYFFEQSAGDLYNKKFSKSVMALQISQLDKKQAKYIMDSQIKCLLRF